MGNKILIIHNPKAGQKQQKNLQAALKEWDFKDNQINYKATAYAGHGTEIAKQAKDDGYEIIVAAGGDGTVNEIASVLVGSAVKLGILPMGSGNGLARHHQIPMQLKSAFEIIIEGNYDSIDVGKINDKNFFCAAGIGFDAHVSALFAKSKLRGLISYFFIALKEYFNYKPKNYTLHYYEDSVHENAFLITFANANQFGNNAFIAPQAQINDGLVDVCVLKPFWWFQGFLLAQHLFNKTIQKSTLYKSFRTSKVEILSDDNLHFHYDGEFCVNQHKHLTISINPKGLKIIVP